MNLRRQLLIASLLLFTLPWAGCQFISEMEGALRQGQEQSLQATSKAVAAVLKDRPNLLYPHPKRRHEADDNNTLYASAIEQSIIIDGYGDDWEERDRRKFQSSPNTQPLSIKFRAATRKGRLFLFFEIDDDDVVFHNPALTREPNGDRLILRTWQDNQRQEYVIATAAPGRVTAQYGSRVYVRGSAQRIRGQWQDTATGYNLELEMPLSLTGGRVGFFVSNASGKPGAGFETLGNVTALDMAPPPWLIYSPDTLQKAITPFGEADRHLQIVDKTHWRLGDILAMPSRSNRESLPDNYADELAQKPKQTFWLVRALYRSILSSNSPPTSPPPMDKGKMTGLEITHALGGSQKSIWYQNPDDSTRALLSAAAPIMDGEDIVGAVIIRQSSEEYLSLTDQAFTHLLGYSLAALGVGVFGLLAYASILSWRIQRLSQAASAVIRDDGSLGDNFPRSKVQDEIGELSRRYAEMLDKLREYNDYLRTLSRKLSHELRTPIAVIQTSLENLEQQDENNSVYIARAREGLARLNKILTAMSEANRLEESIHNNALEETNLTPLLHDIFSAYRSLYPQHELSLACDEHDAMIQAVPDLIVQALDKLMDNAASFCPVRGQIIIMLHRTEEGVDLSVSNDGPALPQELRQHLFDSMVSAREGKSNEVHMGLGLYIVRLIADFHGGSVRAQNRSNGSGVVFTLSFPLSS